MVEHGRAREGDEEGALREIIEGLRAVEGTKGKDGEGEWRGEIMGGINKGYYRRRKVKQESLPPPAMPPNPPSPQRPKSTGSSLAMKALKDVSKKTKHAVGTVTKTVGGVGTGGGGAGGIGQAVEEEVRVGEERRTGRA